MDEDEIPCVLFDPDRTVLIGSGYGLDAVGALPDVDLPRSGAESDADYRARLMAMLREPMVAALTPAVATGEYLDQWCSHEWLGPASGETTAPPDDTKPRENHVRDAVRANS